MTPYFIYEAFGPFKALYQVAILFLKNGPIPTSFSFIFKHITIFTTNKCEKISIQYMVLGFELTTFGT